MQRSSEVVIKPLQTLAVVALNLAWGKVDSIRILKETFVDDNRSIAIEERKPPRRGR
jgi:hypothetical protein